MAGSSPVLPTASQGTAPSRGEEIRAGDRQAGKEVYPAEGVLWAREGEGPHCLCGGSEG